MMSVMQLWSVITIVGGIVMNALLAAYVFNDAQALARSQPGRLKVLSPAVWAVAAFFGSLLGFGLYLAAHHSTLAKDRP